MKMKILAVLQILLGALTTVSAWALVDKKAHTFVDYIGPHLPPNTIFELALSYISLTVFVCGFIQLLAGIKYGWLQAISGLVNAVLASFLVQRQNDEGVFLVSPIYYLAYLPLAFGIVVFITGIIQLTTIGIKGQ